MIPMRSRDRFQSHSARHLWSLALLWGMWGTIPMTVSLGGEPAGGLLRLRDGSQVQGEWQDSMQADEWSWRTPLFESELKIPVAACESFSHPTTQAFPLPDQFWEIRLAGGNLVRGTWTALTPTDLVLQPLTEGGEINLERRFIREMVPRSGVATVVYQGPHGLRGWQDEHGRSEAIDRQGALQLEGQGILLQDVGLPERSVTDLEVTWRGRANFGFQWGVRLARDESDSTRNEPIIPAPARLDAPPEEEGPRGLTELRPFNLEVFRSELWALAETRRGLEKVQVQTLGEPGGRLALRVYLDQRAGQLVVTSATGERLCELLAPEPGRVPGTAIRLVNGRGSVRLEKLRIAHWDGVLRRPPSATSRTAPQGVEVASSESVEWNEETQEILVRGEAADRRFPRREVRRLVLAKGAEREPDSRLVVELVDGSVWRAREGMWRDGNLELSGEAIPAGFRIPRSAVWKMIWAVPSKGVAASPQVAVPAVLQTGTTALSGGLRGVRETPDGRRLEWEWPLGIGTGLLRPEVAARMILREPRQPNRASRRRPGPAAAKPGADTQDDPTQAESRVAVQMASGEVLIAQQVAWQPGTLTITLPTGGKQELADAEVKAVELTRGDAETLELKAALREALLTVPRQGQANPPTHLVRSASGDFLRGQLISLDDTSLVVAVRGREQTLSRDVVAAIVWLHPSDSAAREKGATGGPVAPRVQAFNQGKPGAVLNPERLDGTRLSGTNVIQEQVELDLANLDALLLGDWWDQFPAGNDGSAWRLKPASVPKSFQETDVP